jgi:hypothetical protein
VIEAAHPRFFGAFLRLVESFAVGLPQVEHRAGNRLAVEAAHCAGDEGRNARRALRHVAAVGNLGCVGDMEWSFDGGRRCAGLEAIVDRVDQHAHAHDVGKQDDFLPLLVGHLSAAGDEVDRLEPLGAGRLDVAHERMQMLDE